jgi:hypothetical protein
MRSWPPWSAPACGSKAGRSYSPRMRVIDGSTRHDAHAELNPRPGRCCVVVHGAQ